MTCNLEIDVYATIDVVRADNIVGSKISQTEGSILNFTYIITITITIGDMDKHKDRYTVI
jgi:hypothetical protein